LGDLLDWEDFEGGTVEVSQVLLGDQPVPLGDQHARYPFNIPAQGNQGHWPVDDGDEVEGVDLQKLGVLLLIPIHDDRINPRLGAAI